MIEYAIKITDGNKTVTEKETTYDSFLLGFDNKELGEKIKQIIERSSSLLDLSQNIEVTIRAKLLWQIT
jgi:hypothetical protein